MTTESEVELNTGSQTILGLFAYVDDVIHAIHDLRHAGFDKLVTFSPIPLHDVEHALEHGQPERPKTMAARWKAFREHDIHVVRFTLFGAILGVCTSWLLTFGTAAAWPIPGGGMPIFALPPIGLITYEMGTLGAALGTVGGFLYMSRLPTMKDEVYDMALGSDQFGIAIKDLDAEQFSVAGKIMTNAHALSVEEKRGVLR